MRARRVAQANHASILRRSTRVSTDILIEVQGDGFAYAGEAVTVSLHGSLIRTCAPLKIGMPIIVYVHRTGKSASAHVVFEGYENERHYGIELDRPGNIWGLASSPPTVP